MRKSNMVFIDKALELVSEHFNKSQTDFVKDRVTHLKPSHFYIVWFSKTLGNWKALVSTDAMNGLYYEVTYDGNRRQTYLDVYVKMSNVTIPDDLVGDIFKKENN